MGKKGSMELSVNSIVILIMAITMLGIGIAFMNGMFGSLSTKLEQQFGDIPEPEAATGDKPVSLNDEFLIMESGKKYGAKVSLYNINSSDMVIDYVGLDCFDADLDMDVDKIDFLKSDISGKDSKVFIVSIEAKKVSTEVEKVCNFIVGLKTATSGASSYCGSISASGSNKGQFIQGTCQEVLMQQVQVKIKP
jgi:hypothetical protein